MRLPQLTKLAPADLLLIIDDDALTIEQARSLSEHLACDLLVAGEANLLAELLAARTPTVTILALDSCAFSAAAALRILATAVSDWCATTNFRAACGAAA